MASLKDLRHRPVEGSVDFYGLTVKFVHNASAHTHEYERDLREHVRTLKQEGDEASASEFFARTLPPLLISWDLEDEGEPVPVTEEALLGLPTLFLAELAEAIGKLHRPFGTNGSIGSTGSF